MISSLKTAKKLFSDLRIDTAVILHILFSFRKLKEKRLSQPSTVKIVLTCTNFQGAYIHDFGKNYNYKNLAKIKNHITKT